MTKQSKLEARLNALADYLGVEFIDRGNECMCIKTGSRPNLSEEDVHKIIDQLIHGKEFKDDYERMWKGLEGILKFRIEKELKWSAEDQAKLSAINEIMKANYYEKLNKIEEE